MLSERNISSLSDRGRKWLLLSILCVPLGKHSRMCGNVDLQAVKQLGEAIAELPEGSCSDLLILPLYAAMPLELQVSIIAERSIFYKILF